MDLQINICICKERGKALYQTCYQWFPAESEEHKEEFLHYVSLNCLKTYYTEQVAHWGPGCWKPDCVCLVAQSCLTLCDPMDYSPPGSSVHGDFPGNSLGVGCQALLQRIFPTQGSNSGLLYCRWILYWLSHQETRLHGLKPQLHHYLADQLGQLISHCLQSPHVEVGTTVCVPVLSCCRH